MWIFTGRRWEKKVSEGLWQLQAGRRHLQLLHVNLELLGAIWHARRFLAPLFPAFFMTFASNCQFYFHLLFTCRFPVTCCETRNRTNLSKNLSEFVWKMCALKGFMANEGVWWSGWVKPHMNGFVGWCFMHQLWEIMRPILNDIN